MDEQIKDIPGYEKVYGITRDGKVWSYRNNKFLKTRNRYKAITIELNYKGVAKEYQVGKLVYAAWNNNDLSLLKDKELIYKDNNSKNIDIDNLSIINPSDILKEEIRPIPNFPDYGATYSGKIWSFKTKQFLSEKTTEKNYRSVNLFHNGKRKTVLVHRAVLSAWHPIENYEEMQVNHKDEIRYNNCVDNLEWCDCSYNINYGTRNKKVGEKLCQQVRCIETGQIFNSQHEVAEFLGHKWDGNISNCLNGRQETTGGYHWEWVNKNE